MVAGGRTALAAPVGGADGVTAVHWVLLEGLPTNLALPPMFQMGVGKAGLIVQVEALTCLTLSSMISFSFFPQGA